MKQITLERINLQGFKSFSVNTDINLTTQAGLKFIGGDNQVNPALGANGSGKSSIFDAIFWCLYGESVRGKKTAELISRGQTKTIVTTIWKVDDKYHAITRMGPPNRLLLDNSVAKQADVEELIGLSKDRFLQSVIFGQAMPLFYDLSIPERGELLDEILDLGLWLKLSDYAGKQSNKIAWKITANKEKLAWLQGRLGGMQRLDELEKLEVAWQEQHEQTITDLLDQVVNAQTHEAQHVAAKNTASSQLAILADLTKKREAIQALRSQQGELQGENKLVRTQIDKANTLHDLFIHRWTCPTCHQQIPIDFAEKKAREAWDEADQLTALLDDNLKEFAKLNGHIEAHEQQYEELANQRQELIRLETVSDLAIKTCRQQIDRLMGQVEKLIDEKRNPYTEQLKTLRAEIADLEWKLKAQQEEVASLQGKQLVTDYWKSGFKRVRLYLVKRVLSHLELETANAANSLGLIGWRISFATELETKSGTLKSGIHIQVSAGKGEERGEWSPGELQRVRLAVAMGLSAIIQRMAGVNYTFATFDEPTNWLSHRGISDLLESLKSYAEMYNKSVWLIDHRALDFSGFSEVWQVTKTEDGSQVTMMGRTA